MKRKTIKQGLNAVTITIPTQWVKKNNIKAGDELEVKEESNILNIYPNQEKEYSSKSIDVRGLSNILIWRELSSAYRAGYDEIKVKFENTKDKVIYSAFTYNTIFDSKGKKGKLDAIEVIQSLVNRSIGVEIIEQSSSECTIKEMSELSHKEFDNILRRVFLLIKNMIETINNAITKKEMHELRNIHLIDTNLDRFEDFCIRVLNKIGYKEIEKTTLMYNTVFFLELIGDEYKQLALEILETGSIGSEIKQLIIEINNQFHKYYELFYSFNNEKADKIFAKNEALKSTIKKIDNRMSAPEAKAMHHCASIRKFIYSLSETKVDMQYL